MKTTNYSKVAYSGKTICVWFSCGAASAVAAKMAIDRYGAFNNVIVVNTPILEEHVDNLRFKKDVENWIGQPIISVTAKKFPKSSISEVFVHRKYMSGIHGAPCTLALKKQARYEFELNNKIDYHIFGFTVNELSRHVRFVKYERSNVIPILIDYNLSKYDCFDILDAAGISRPFIYDLGFPNANCIGCVKSQSATYWNLVREKFPVVFAERSILSRNLNCKLVKYKGKRLFLDELPLSAKGGIIRNWDCGLFCNEFNQLLK